MNCNALQSFPNQTILCFHFQNRSAWFSLRRSWLIASLCYIYNGLQQTHRYPQLLSNETLMNSVAKNRKVVRTFRHFNSAKTAKTLYCNLFACKYCYYSTAFSWLSRNSDVFKRKRSSTLRYKRPSNDKVYGTPHLGIKRTPSNQNPFLFIMYVLFLFLLLL